ncbi:hypothetical protein AL538_28750 [Vibrio harveyi]|uniref:Uncharacterized protein n=1 Tax=Vibrio harveyi TaxID=669 RepID=A0ABN5GVR1_VIBHA|nr:hypothetical protein AL538_28750 [Vibrio harveyi]
METLFSYSSSVTIGYVYSIFVEKNAKSVGVCAYKLAKHVYRESREFVTTHVLCPSLLNKPSSTTKTKYLHIKTLHLIAFSTKNHIKAQSNPLKNLSICIILHKTL